MQASVEWPGASPAVVRASFAGQVAYTMADGEALVISDPIPPSAFGLQSFPANTAFWVRHARTIPSGGKFVRAEQGASPAISGEGQAQCDPATDPQLDTTGALITSGSYSAYTENVKPLAIVGRTATPQVCVADVGDSIAYRLNDAIGDGANGAGGWFQRAMANVGGSHVPYVRLAIPSERGQTFAGGTRRQSLLPFVTHLLCNYGTNDLAGARTAAQTLADLRTIWAQAKAAGVQRVEQLLILPRTSSTDSWASVASQTPVTSFAAGGARDALNASILANVGANGLDAVLDLNGIVADAGQPDRWTANGAASYATADGVHPQPVMHASIAAAVQARAAGWSAGP